MNTKLIIRATLVVAIAAIAVPAPAGWLDVLVTPAAYEEIAAPEAINPPVQDDHSVIIDMAPPAIPQAVEPYYESYSPIYPPIAAAHGSYGHCCEKPRVVYRNHPILAMLMHKCKTGQAGQVVVQVPTGCCPTEVILCVPLCCTTCPPEVDKSRDLLGRCVFTYCWPCGTKINIVQRHTGDLVVHSYEI
ncbi:hypothetical protein Poly24_47900 [Rosistilla carotiformis]|uniref:Uncharacterized protein n=1 Tax=Rosistilla carotiformis TaxID=2528017 RepID=A0A518JZS8_9BACT|nr:hypothetical protein [Rosistilla carotiformis]QDV71057.1 hypothetical protein Poly24_47900 [Rosistilla carotiformis]